MKKKIVADNVIKLLKQGYSPKEVTERMAVSYNYAWKLKKLMEAGVEAKVETFTPKAGEYIEVEGAQSAQEIDAILDERATTYGSFVDVAGFAQEMKNAIRVCNNSELDDDQMEALDMITSKIARIVHGNPNYVDSWTDIAGYATLVADRLQGKSR